MSQTKDTKLTIIDRAKKHVKLILKNELPKNFSFHTYRHARNVAGMCVQLGEEAGLKNEELITLELAAWFHDTGYIKGREQHETASVAIASKFLNKEGCSDRMIKDITVLIFSTRLEHEPANLTEEILHDADLSHLGKKSFFAQSELLRAELESTENLFLTELEWHKKQYNFITNHPFITAQAQSTLGKRRAKNIKKQRDKINDSKKITRRLQTGKDFGRGIDTLYRSTYRNHINFSSIADGKANMMISINTILISVIVTLSGASFSIMDGFELPSLRFTIPILILLLGSLFSVFFAVMSARPKVTEKDVSKRKVKKRDVSLLFFGNFLEVEQKAFIDHLSELKHNQKELYDSMSMDIYDLGVVLKEKYRLLTISYTVFITGLTLCVLGYIGIFLITNVM